MKILVLAKSDQGLYLGVDTEDDFCVFTIQGHKEIHIGELLQYEPDDLSTPVGAITIGFELITGSLSEAIASLTLIGQPGAVMTLRRTFSVESNDVISRIERELFPCD